MPSPTTIASWPSHTARSPGGSAFGTMGAPSPVYCVAKSVGRVGVRRGRWSTCSYSLGEFANICYFCTLAVARSDNSRRTRRAPSTAVVTIRPSSCSKRSRRAGTLPATRSPRADPENSSARSSRRIDVLRPRHRLLLRPLPFDPRLDPRTGGCCGRRRVGHHPLLLGDLRPQLIRVLRDPLSLGLPRARGTPNAYGRPSAAP